MSVTVVVKTMDAKRDMCNDLNFVSWERNLLNEEANKQGCHCTVYGNVRAALASCAPEIQ